MSQTVIGLFDDRDEAQRVVRDFLDQKFPGDKVSVVTTDAKGEFVRQAVTAEPGNNAGHGAAVGALSGAIVGGVFGILVGASVLVVPGLGLLAAGPIAIALASAGVGAVGGGILGALIGLGIPKDQVQTYAEAIRRGGCVVAVEVNEADIVSANDIMRKHHAVDIHQRAAYFQSEGFSSYDANAAPYTPEEMAADQIRMRLYTQSSASAPIAPTMQSTSLMDDPAIRDRYNSTSSKGLVYEEWEPAYRFGSQIGQDPQYASFVDSESRIRQAWEQSHPGTFERYLEAIHAGYEDSFGRRSGASLI